MSPSLCGGTGKRKRASVKFAILALTAVGAAVPVAHRSCGPSFSTTNRCNSNCSTTKRRKISRCGSNCSTKSVVIPVIMVQAVGAQVVALYYVALRFGIRFIYPGCTRNPVNQASSEGQRKTAKEERCRWNIRLSNAITVQSRQMAAVAIF